MFANTNKDNAFYEPTDEDVNAGIRPGYLVEYLGFCMDRLSTMDEMDSSFGDWKLEYDAWNLVYALFDDRLASAQEGQAMEEDDERETLLMRGYSDVKLTSILARKDRSLRELVVCSLARFTLSKVSI